MTENEWTGESFVAFLDIMGFKNKIMVDGHDEVKKMLMKLRSSIKAIEKIASINEVINKMKDRNAQIPSGVYPVTFSDSIILISTDKSYGSFKILLKFVAYIIREAFSNEIPIKGAIAFGKMTADINNSLYFGKPLIDAFELQDELKLYGVILHHTVEERLTDPEILQKNLHENDDILKYNTPIKSGKITHYTVDWTKLVTEEPRSMIEKLYNTVSGAPRIYVDNTLDFVKEIEKRKAELKQKETKEKPL
jgi:hypothetical protein